MDSLVPDTCPVAVNIGTVASGDLIEILEGTRIAARVADIIPSQWPGIAWVYFDCGVIALRGRVVDRYA